MELTPMAWSRGKGKEGRADGQPPPAPPAPSARPLVPLPVVREEGTTQDREALKRMRRAEADLRRLERRDAQALKREERRHRAIDRRLARIERSRDAGPGKLLTALAVPNGIAAALAVLYLWWPDWPLYEPLFLQGTAHWEIVILCFVASTLVSAYVLTSNPSTTHLVRAQYALGVYVATGIIGTFSGLLLGHVLVDMELMELDWELWLWVLLVTATGSAGAMTTVYAVAHRTGSRSFLRGPYHRAMGVVTAVLATSLAVLPFVYLPYKGWMHEVGVSVTYVGWLMVAFPLPAVVVSVFVRGRSEELARNVARA